MKSLEGRDGVNGDDDIVEAAGNVGAFSGDKAKAELASEKRGRAAALAVWRGS